MSVRNLFCAWREFRRGKRKKQDVQEFEFNLEDNLFELHDTLVNGTYEHAPYESFYVQDPKLRHIHKASVRDRVLHQAVFRIVYPIFNKSFIFDSYSCRIRKGTHRAVRRLHAFARKLSRNNRRTIFALKCDVRKFFDSVDHKILLNLIQRRIRDDGALRLIRKIIESFPRGLPLGNVISQLFANIYLNELDQFVKCELKEKQYVRYCDDFIILGEHKEALAGTARKIDFFLRDALKLALHDRKIIIRKFAHGIDFLGYVVLPQYRVLRTKTKRRIFKKLSERKMAFEQGKMSDSLLYQSLQSYRGVLTHCKGFKIEKKLRLIYDSKI